jgi:hypothetical protein
MGVKITFYVMYGVKISWDNAFIKAYEKAYFDDDRPEALYDGMNGDYIILGVVLDRLDPYDDTEYVSDVNVSHLAPLEAAYRENFCKKFPDYANLLGDKPFKIISLVHHT